MKFTFPLCVFVLFAQIASAQSQPATNPAAMALLQEGETEFAAKHFDRAIELFTQAAQADPSFLRAHHALAQTYAASGKDDRAISEYRTILKLTPDDPAAHYRLTPAAGTSEEDR